MSEGETAVASYYSSRDLWHKGREAEPQLLVPRESTLAGWGVRSHFWVHFPVEAEKKREAKQRAKEAQERELRKREKAEEKERRRKEYDALKAAKREQEKKPKKETNQAPSTWWLSQGSSWGAAGAQMSAA